MVTLKEEKLPLELRSVFGTSHSATIRRTNVLYTVSIGAATGYGESGLPPKKPGVPIYEADADDCLNIFTQWKTAVGEIPAECTYDFFRGLQPANIDAAHLTAVRHLFACLDGLEVLPPHTPGTYRAAKSGIEAALWDCLGVLSGQPVHALFGLTAVPRPGFYTAGLDEPDTMIRNAVEGHRTTPYLKIKVDADVAKCVAILHRIRDALFPSGYTGSVKLWSVDANSACSPAVAREYLEALRPFANLVYMIEQPFPFDVLSRGEGEWAEWVDLKAKFAEIGILVYADESMKTAADVAKLLPIVHGVNVKLEKAGGLRAGLDAIETAGKAGLGLWLGSMVGSTLNSATPAHLLPLAGHGDLDGSMLVQSASDPFEGGFDWLPGNHASHPGHISLTPRPGLGVIRKTPAH